MSFYQQIAASVSDILWMIRITLSICPDVGNNILFIEFKLISNLIFMALYYEGRTTGINNDIDRNRDIARTIIRYRMRSPQWN